MPGRFDPIDHVLALDLGRRGIADLFTPGAAIAAARALTSARRVLIATGFTVAADTPETDGPPGAAALGRALRLAGAHVSYVTDAHNVPIVEAALKAHDEPVSILVYPAGDGHGAAWIARERPTHLVAIERPGRASSGDYLNLRGVAINDWNRRIDEMFIAAYTARRESSRAVRDDLARSARRVRSGAGSDDHGPSASGGPRRRSHSDPSRPRRRSAGTGPWTPPHSAPAGSTGAVSRASLRRAGSSRAADRRGDELGAAGAARAVVAPITIGIGDGGNEIGMGNVRARLVRRRSPLARVASVVRVDHLVAAGTSNWGAYGVVAALQRLTGLELLHDPAIESRVIDACVAAGAFDGVTRRREVTVDGLGPDVHAEIVHLLHLAARCE